MRGRIIIFSGYAGAGKNTIINNLMSEIDDFVYIPSVTTRKKRNGETEGDPYYFKSLDEFNSLKEEGRFIETENIHGNMYGTLKDRYIEELEKGKTILKDIDVNGAMGFKRLFKDDVYLVFIKPSNDFTVLDRMKDRGDSEEDIKIRKERIYYETSFIKYFDSIVVNDDLTTAVNKSKEIIKEVYKKKGIHG